MDESAKSITEYIYENFDIKKYASARDLNLVGWANALLFRYTNTLALSPDRVRNKEREKLVSQISAGLLANPIPRVDFSDNLLLRGPTYSRCVNEICVLDVFEMNDSAQNIGNLYAEFSSYWDDLHNENLHQFPEIPPDLFNSYDAAAQQEGVHLSPEYGHIRVNLNATDKQLLEDFEVWLKNRRLDRNRKNIEASSFPQFTPAKLKQWCEANILGYLDLVFFEVVLEIEIPYHKKALLLFPAVYDIDTTERVRKVTKPLADRLMHSATIEALTLAAEQYILNKVEEN